MAGRKLTWRTAPPILETATVRYSLVDFYGKVSAQ